MGSTYWCHRGHLRAKEAADEEAGILYMLKDLRSCKKKAYTTCLICCSYQCRGVVAAEIRYAARVPVPQRSTAVEHAN